jgi:hypothetical protein
MITYPARALIDISSQQHDAVGDEEDGLILYIREDGYAAMPYPFKSTLYRGQNERIRPFLPSIARGLEATTGKMSEMIIEDQAKVVIRLAQSWWFAQEVEHHPLTQFAKEENRHLNRLALAQHYEIPTGYLDLSHSFDVAAFFASCYRTSSGWEPVKSGIGVVYRVELDQVKSPYNLFDALGPQPLPRPFEQKAWVTELPMIDAFDGWPFVFVMEFEHNEAVGKHFLEKFDGGNKLFPPDPLANVSHEIRECGEIPSVLIDGAIKSFSEDDLGILKSDFTSVKEAVRKKISLVSYRRLLMEKDLLLFQNEFESRKQHLAGLKVNVRPVRLVEVTDKN